RRVPVRLGSGAAPPPRAAGAGRVSFVEGLRRRAREHRRTIVLPEGLDERTLAAATRLAAEGLADPIVLAPEDAEIDRGALHPAIRWIDPARDERADGLARILWERRRARGMTEDQAARAAIDPLLFGALMVAAGEADGSVAGAVNATGDVLRAAFWAIGPAPGITTVSSSFYMVVPPRSS